MTITVELLEKHSEECRSWAGPSANVLNFEALACDVLNLDADKDWRATNYYLDNAASKLFDELLESGLVSYYARPRENFFVWRGVELAAEEGKRFVILEDMS